MMRIRSNTGKIASVLIVVLSLLVTIPVAYAGDADGLAATLSSGDRADADKARDAMRKPAEVVTFLGVASGMTVIDLIAASGYYTEVLSVAVGEKGKVYAQNGAFVLKMREGANEKAITKRLAGNRLPNVERLNREMTELGLAAGSVDVAVTALNFHDIYNRGGPEGAAKFLGQVKAVLKSGGVLGIVDHDGNPENDNKELHRMTKAQAVKSVTDAGFEIVAEGEMLRNSEDDRAAFVFAEGMRGKTDRFVLKSRKP